MVTTLLLVAALAALVAVALAGLAAKSRKGAPPGLQDGRLAACAKSTNCVCSETGDVEPLGAFVWPKIADAVTAEGGTVTKIEEDYLAAAFSSKLFGFVDDVEFRKAEDVVHIRSASRVGQADFGANKERVGRLRAALDRRAR